MFLPFLIYGADIFGTVAVIDPLIPNSLPIFKHTFMDRAIEKEAAAYTGRQVSVLTACQLIDAWNLPGHARVQIFDAVLVFKLDRLGYEDDFLCLHGFEHVFHLDV